MVSFYNIYAFFARTTMAPVFLKTKATRKNNNKIGEKTRSDNNEKRLIKIVLGPS